MNNSKSSQSICKSTKNKYKQMKYTCQYCHKDLSYSNYRIHNMKKTCGVSKKYSVKKIHKSLYFVCLLPKKSNDCGNPIRHTATSLCNHFQSYHSDTEELEFSCSKCKMKFPINVMLKRHCRQFHEGNYKCTFCGDRFGEKESCTKHEMAHKNLTCEVKYKCRFCDYRAVDILYINNHEKNQHRFFGFEGYKCDRCPREYKKKSRLQEHLRDFHGINSSPINLICEVCNNASSTLLKLKLHKRNCHGMAVDLNNIPKSDIPIKEEQQMTKNRFIVMTDYGIKYFCEICKKVCSSQRGLSQHQKYYNHTETDKSTTIPALPLVVSKPCNIVDVPEIKIRTKNNETCELTNANKSCAPTYLKATNEIIVMAPKKNERTKCTLTCPVKVCSYECSDFLKLDSHLTAFHELE